MLFLVTRDWGLKESLSLCNMEGEVGCYCIVLITYLDT